MLHEYTHSVVVERSIYIIGGISDKGVQCKHCLATPCGYQGQFFIYL